MLEKYRLCAVLNKQKNNNWVCDRFSFSNLEGIKIRYNV